MHLHHNLETDDKGFNRDMKSKALVSKAGELERWKQRNRDRMKSPTNVKINKLEERIALLEKKVEELYGNSINRNR